VGTAVIIILLRQPNLGFILIFLGGMFVPFTGPSGLNMATVMVALMLGLWIMDMFIVQRNFVLIRSRVMIPIITFLVIAILAFGMGQIPWFVFARQAPITAQVGGFAIFIFSIGGMLLSAHLIKDTRWLKNVVWAFLILAGIYVASRVLRLSPISRLYNAGYVAQSMSWTWLIALAFSQLIYNNKLTNRTKGMLVALVILTFYVGVFQDFDWKSGWVPALLAVLILLGLRYRRLVVFAIPFVGLAAVYAATKLIGTDEYSWGTRNDAWRIVLEISRVSPLLGMGFSNYYWYTPLFPIRGWHVSFNSHSQFIDLIAQTGYLGLIGFLWIFFAIGRLSFDLGNRLPDGFARAYSYGVLAGLIATLVAAYLGDWVLPFVYNVGLSGFRASILPWIFMGGVIGLEQMFLHNPAYKEIDSHEE
jgi:O-antigen ligase